MIDPRRLGVLQAVAVHGSVVDAAGALHLSPPAVSQQLRALERETGASLIDRSGRQIRLTAAGRLLAAHGEHVAAQLRQAERDSADATSPPGTRPVPLSPHQPPPPSSTFSPRAVRRHGRRPDHARAPTTRRAAASRHNRGAERMAERGSPPAGRSTARPGRVGRPGPGNRRGRLPRHRRHWGITGAARR